MQHGHDHFEGALSGGMSVDRYATTVVDHFDLAVGVQDHIDPRGLVGHRLVDAVVDHLPDQLMETSSIGGADVHARPLAYGLKALKHLDAGRGIRRHRLGAPWTPLGLRGHDRSASAPRSDRCTAAPRVMMAYRRSSSSSLAKSITRRPPRREREMPTRVARIPRSCASRSSRSCESGPTRMGMLDGRLRRTSSSVWRTESP